ACKTDSRSTRANGYHNTSISDILPTDVFDIAGTAILDPNGCVIFNSPIKERAVMAVLCVEIRQVQAVGRVRSISIKDKPNPGVVFCRTIDGRNVFAIIVEKEAIPEIAARSFC